MHCYKYPRAALTVDAVVFSKEKEGLEVLLIQRKNNPFKGMWALPGGFLEIGETCEHGACRELEEETGMKDVKLVQFGVFDAIDRDPRERIITVAHWGITEKSKHTIKGADDAVTAQWHKVESLPPLATDHGLIIETALKKLKEL